MSETPNRVFRASDELMDRLAEFEDELGNTRSEAIRECVRRQLQYLEARDRLADDEADIDIGALLNSGVQE